MTLLKDSDPPVAAVPSDVADETTAIAGSGASVVASLEDAVVLDELVAKARGLIPRLREEQADTEERRTYSPDIHERFIESGLYDVVRPKRYGGYGLGVAALNRVLLEIARGCPSTGWGYVQDVGHTLIVSSHWPEQAQEEIFGTTRHVMAPGSAQAVGMEVVEVDGGIRISGKYQYGSGAPYSTHFMGMLGPWVTGAVEKYEGDANRWFIATRDQYEVLDDWGAVMGLKGSGSNSVVFDDAFIPQHMIVDGQTFMPAINGPTPGSVLHDSGLYAGPFLAQAEVELCPVVVGTGYAAINEFERIIRKSKVRGTDLMKVDTPDVQRALGTALGWVDTAAATAIRLGQLYDEYAREAHKGIAQFSEAKAWRLNAAAYWIEQQVYEAINTLMRSAGSSSLIDGARLQRYYRDVTTMTTRANRFETDVLYSAKAYLGI